MEETLISPTPRAVFAYLIALVFIVLGIIYNNIYTTGLGVVFAALVFGFKTYVAYIASSLGNVEIKFEYDMPIDSRDFEIRMIVQNPARLPLAFIEYNIQHSPYIKFAKGATRGFLVVPGKGSVIVRLICSGRVGSFRVGPVEFVARDVFGLYRSIVFTRNIFVDIKIPPSYSPAIVRRLLAYARSLGLSRIRQHGYGVEFHSLREYRPGDEPKFIEWRKSIRYGSLVTKLMEKESQNNVYILLDASNVMLTGPYGKTIFEHMARSLASVVAYLAVRGDNIGFVIFGYSNILASNGLYRGHIARAEFLRAVSSIDYEKAIADRSKSLEQARDVLLRNLRRERNIIFITTVIDSKEYFEAVSKLSEELRNMGNIVYVVNPVATSYDVQGLPPWARGYYMLKTFDLATKQTEFSKALRMRGIASITVTSVDAPFKIAQKIEQYRLK
ncbi:DUF58 domain-containing protein [Thermogladius sp. 4427co]|uniref:DUF58 domain-containing protein n=1 Tax=Thermogladius sp. 4427co TaxID=3450718 RepID=UPI003F79F840